MYNIVLDYQYSIYGIYPPLYSTTVPSESQVDYFPIIELSYSNMRYILYSCHHSDV